jgi:hypothetical protein
MWFVWIWGQTAIISLYSINWLVFFITEAQSVYCAVRAGSLNQTDRFFVPQGLNSVVSRLICSKLNCVKYCTKNWNECSLAQRRFLIRFVSFFVSSVECLEMMPLLCRQVNRGNCGIPWVNCAVICVEDCLKEQFSGLRYCLSKLGSLLSFSVRYDVIQWNRSV